MSQNKEQGNHLIHESSPYLLQHAHNPVDWYPWGKKALNKAEKENKLLIVSIGYSACHWCHVMEHESFEDSTVAAMMNEHFVSIKVDREERPDIDDIYMTACQLINRSGGWPLNAFALPDGRPVWAGTYFPKDRWLEVLGQFSKLWKDEPQKLKQYAEQLTQGIQSQDLIQIAPTSNLDINDMHDMAMNLVQQIDMEKGGRKGAPKFPMPVNFEFLLAYSKMANNAQASQAVAVTLDNMMRGGIYDHIGGGFARYSVDSMWFAPHFEKMLYDNGQLMSLYAKAYKSNGNDQYLQIVDEIYQFVSRELLSPENGFYSSLDADSEGEEGKFYVWSVKEVDSLLSEKEAALIRAYYNIENKGNWENGQNILYTKRSFAEEAHYQNTPEDEAQKMLARAKQKLFDYRAERIRPGLDDKILCAWNALMNIGLTDAYSATGDIKYLDLALKNLSFIEDKLLKKDDRLDRNYKQGESKINGFLDDYAFLIKAYVNLYEVTFEYSYLNKARALAEYVMEHFFNSNSQMFNYTSNLDDPLVARKMEISDNVIPASNSVIARSLHRLGLLFEEENYVAISDQMLFNLLETLQKGGQTAYYANWAHLFLEKAFPTYEIAIVGKNYASLLKEMQQKFFPNSIFLGAEDEGQLALLEDKLVAGQTRIYVCQNKVCQKPETEVAAAVKQIRYLQD